jgi:hypothetical protein
MRKNCHAYRSKTMRSSDVDATPGSAKSYDVEIFEMLDTRDGSAPVELRPMAGHLVIFRGNLFMTTHSKLSCGCAPTSTLGNRCEIHEDATLRLLMRKLRDMLEFPDTEATSSEHYTDTIYCLGYCADLVKGMSVLRDLSAGLAAPSTRRNQNMALLECFVNPCNGRHIDAGFRPVPKSAAAAAAEEAEAANNFPSLSGRTRDCGGDGNGSGSSGGGGMAKAATALADVSYAHVAKHRTGAAADDEGENGHDEGDDDDENGDEECVAEQDEEYDDQDDDADDSDDEEEDEEEDEDDDELPFLNEKPERCALHKTQRVVLEALRNPVEGVQGPPGTGKTTLVRSILRERLPLGRRNVALLTGVQNKVVDLHIAALQAYVNVDVATSRVGMMVIGRADNPRLSFEARSFTLEGLLVQNAEVIAARLRYDAAKARKAAKAELSLLCHELQEARASATARLFRSVRILVCTLTEVNKLHSLSLKEDFLERIESVVVDEAGTVPPWKMALLAALPRVRRVVCVGDPQQLPPFTNIKRNAPPSHLERMQRQLLQQRFTMPMLTVNFRMHRDIEELVSKSFYGGKLSSDVAATHANAAARFVPGGLVLSGLYWLDYSGHVPSISVVERMCSSGTTWEIVPAARAAPFHHAAAARGREAAKAHSKPGHDKSKGRRAAVAGGGNGGGTVALTEASCSETYETSIHKSFANAVEIEHLERGLRVFLHHGLFNTGAETARTVAVISFYKEHIKLLERRLRACPDYGAVFSVALDFGMLRVLTVDGSQGDEADIVLVSGVRSNLENDVGFLNDTGGRNRLCVALSRARAALVVVGDKRTLTQCRGYNYFWPEGMAPGKAHAAEVKLLGNFEPLAEASAAARSRFHWSTLVPTQVLQRKAASTAQAPPALSEAESAHVERLKAEQRAEWQRLEDAESM